MTLSTHQERGSIPYQLTREELVASDKLDSPEKKKRYQEYCAARAEFYQVINAAMEKATQHSNEPGNTITLDQNNRYDKNEGPIVIKNGACYYVIFKNPFDSGSEKPVIIARVQGPRGPIDVKLNNQKYGDLESQEPNQQPLNYAGVPTEGGFLAQKQSSGIDTSRFKDIENDTSIAKMRIMGNMTEKDKTIAVNNGTEQTTLYAGEILIENVSPDKTITVLT